MFSKSASKRLRQDFWIAFGKSYPRKWILYDTKIKGLSLKFNFDLKSAIVSIDVEHADLGKRIELWEKLISLKTILKEEYLPKAIFNDSFILQNQKEISRVYVVLENVSVHNKDSWRDTMEFFNMNMAQLEDFFENYKDVLKS